MDTRAATGRKSEYIFKTDSGGIRIDIGQRGCDERDAEYYHYIEGKGTTAIRRLIEEHSAYRQFFLNVLKLAELDSHGRLVGFVGVRDVDNEQETAWERAAEIIEEVSDWEEDK